MGKEGLARRVDALEQPLVLLVRSLAAEADEREVARSHDLPAGLVLDPALEHLRKADVLANPLLQALAAEAAQNGPELERAEAPAEGDRDLAQVDRVVGRLQELGNEAERPPKVVGPSGPEGGAIHRRPEPLVRVDGDRVGALPAREVVTELGADRGRTRVGGVDMEPDARLRAEIRERRNGIHRARARRPDGRDERAGAFQVDCFGPHAGSSRPPAPSAARARAGSRPCPRPSAHAPSRARRAVPAAAPSRRRARTAPRSKQCPRCDRGVPAAGRAAARASRGSPPRAPGARATYARGSRPGSGRPRAARPGSPAPLPSSRSRRRTAGSASASGRA